MILETKKYTLRILDPSCSYDILRYNEKNRVFHKDSMPKRKDDFFTLDHSEYMLEEELKKTRDGIFYRFYIFKKRESNIIGDISLYDVKYGHISSAFMGIKIDQEHSNQGVGSEVVSSIIDFAKNELNLHSLRVTIYEDNISSQKLFTKFGFTYDGKIKDLFYGTHGWMTHELYSLIL